MGFWRRLFQGNRDAARDAARVASIERIEAEKQAQRDRETIRRLGGGYQPLGGAAGPGPPPRFRSGGLVPRGTP
jgi:hypothetical protein